MTLLLDMNLLPTGQQPVAALRQLGVSFQTCRPTGQWIVGGVDSATLPAELPQWLSVREAD